MAPKWRQAATPRGWASFRRWARAGLVSVLAGCQVVPAHIATCTRSETRMPRLGITTRQVMVDSALEIIHHPVRSAGTLVREPSLALRASADGLHKRALKCAPTPPPLSENSQTLDPDALEAELRQVAGDPLVPAHIELITDGWEALTALEAAFEAATARIDILMYLWDNDPIGWQIARHLAARASPTLQVRVIVDGGGNLLQGQPREASAGEVNAVVCWLAQQPHVQVIRNRTPFFRFDHRKFVLIDGRMLWSGGRNFTSESFRKAHDLTYLLTGPLTAELATRFERSWEEHGGPPGSLRAPGNCEMPAPEPNTQVRLVRTRPYESDLARAVYTAVDRARHHIYVENPYFTDNRLMVKLMQARRRGVDVRVVTTLESGSSFTDIVNRVTVNRLLKAGIRVYLYPGLTHVKALSVDGLWAYIGTGNFDALSLRHNREFGVAVSHGPLVTTLEDQLFLADFQAEWKVTNPLPTCGFEYLVELIGNFFL